MNATVASNLAGAVLERMRPYLDALPPHEQDEAAAQLRGALPADLRAVGVSEPLRPEHDYQVDRVDGALPEGLAGTLYRNGPGKWEDATGRPLRHLFDGDGMISAFTIAPHGIRYRNRYVRTRHYLGKGSRRELGTPAPGGIPSNIARIPPNLANTNVVEHAGRLFALWEGGPPHEVDPRTLQTLGTRRFGGRLRWLGSYSAHPCVCPSSGAMFNFGVEVFPRPHLRVYRTDAAGRLRRHSSAALPYLAMVHDFAITERHVVFLVSPIVPEPLPIARGLKTIGDALSYKPELGSAFVVIPRDGGKPRVVEHEAVLQFHISNAYDDRGDVVVDSVTYTDDQLLSGIARFRTRSLRAAPSTFTRFRVPRSGPATSEPLMDVPCEFPRHHPGREGREHRYSYMNTRHRLSTLYDGITKLDLETGEQRHVLAESSGNSFCEPVFVPRPRGESEDDGWLLSVEYLAESHTSRLVVLDARRVEAGPVAAAELRHHIPQGFHGNFSPSPSC